jgi:hypothetical protein
VKLPESLRVSPTNYHTIPKQTHVTEVQKDSRCKGEFLPASLYILRSALP